MIINIEEIEKLIFNLSISAYRIEKETGISRMTITNYRNGIANMEKMTVSNAMKLQKMIEENKKRASN